MSKRNFPDFLSAYLEFSRDGFCPDQFHFWTGISAVSGALERKVWVTRGAKRVFPNTYVLLIARPGVGKSSAGEIGVSLLRRLGTEENRIRFIADQNSQASFISQFAGFNTFYGGNKEHTHASRYFFASEGSNSLSEIKGGGSILPVLTDFYDCPSEWNKNLKMSDERLFNVSCSMLACATFAFLNELIPQREVEGGFASRLMFIVQDEIFVRSPKWDAAAPPGYVRSACR